MLPRTINTRHKLKSPVHSLTGSEAPLKGDPQPGVVELHEQHIIESTFIFKHAFSLKIIILKIEYNNFS